MNRPTMPALRPGVIVALSALSLAPLGCGPSGPFPVHPVRGEVFVNGKPAAGAEVTFHPLADGEKRYFPAATVDKDGSFRLTTWSANDGAPAGDYAVSVLWCDTYRDEGETRYGPDRLRYRYYHPGSSGLKATVKPGNNELPRFDLK